MAPLPLQGGCSVIRTIRLPPGSLPRLLYQLVPAALVTAVGVLLLSNLAKVPDAPPAAAGRDRDQCRGGLQDRAA